MPIDQQEMRDALADRIESKRVLDLYDSTTQDYRSWKERISVIDQVYANEIEMVWPDQRKEFSVLSVPNLVVLSIEDRARMVAAGNPTRVCRPEKANSPSSVAAAEKRERILGGYWATNHVQRLFPTYAMDLMSAGLTATKVMPDVAKPKEYRFPKYSRVDPRAIFPSPVFATGPFLDDCVVSYKMKWRDVVRQYDLDPAFMGQDAQFSDPTNLRVIEYYDGDQIAVLCERIQAKDSYVKPKAWVWLVEPTKHKLSHTPIVIGTRVGLNGEYRGDFDAAIPILNSLNKMFTMHLDSASQQIYAAKAEWNVANPEDWGPDALIHYEGPDGKIEYVVNPGGTYSAHQLMDLQMQFARISSIFPPSRSGDPNESIISAAGITATQSQLTDHVRSLERDSIQPMLEAANELAFECDEKWGDVTKTISGVSRGTAYRETYKPTKDIAGNYSNELRYGFASGMDAINGWTLASQQMGQGVISRLSAQEMSPIVEDPQRENKQIALEKLDEAIFAGLVAKAAQGMLDPATLAAVRKDLESDMTLAEAIEAHPDAATMAQPPGSPAPPGAPGLPGAARGEQPQEPMGPMPDLENLLVGGRP